MIFKSLMEDYYSYSTNYFTPDNAVDERIGDPSYTLDKGESFVYFFTLYIYIKVLNI